MKKILICGNEACASAAIAAGCRFYAGYPITPQNELIAYMARNLPKAGGVFIQAESELAAINMVLGASAGGTRAMTSSSSPGISLKQEGISYLAGCELPAVIANVMRGGPGLGNISPSQADYFQATRGGGHGDYRTIALAPSTCQEFYDLTIKSFNLADTYRTPVIILADGMLGQMTEPIIPWQPESKTEIPKPWTLSGCGGREPRVIKSLYLGDGVLEQHNAGLQEKYNRIAKNETLYEESLPDTIDILVVAYGTTARIVQSTLEDMPNETSSHRIGYFRPITVWPFPSAALAVAAKKARVVFVVEMSAGQMVEDVRLVLQDDSKIVFYGKMGGTVPTKKDIQEQLIALLKRIEEPEFSVQRTA